MKDEELFERGKTPEVLDVIFDSISRALEYHDAADFRFSRACLFIESRAGLIFSKSLRKAPAKCSFDRKCNSSDTALFVEEPGFSLERWAFWAKRLDHIRATWDFKPVLPGMRSIPGYAKAARHAMEEVEEKAALTAWEAL